MARTSASPEDQHAHAIGAAALLIIQKTLQTLVAHGIITTEQLDEIYESARQEHEGKRHVFQRIAVHEKIGSHLRQAGEGYWPPDDIQ